MTEKKLAQRRLLMIYECPECGETKSHRSLFPDGPPAWNRLMHCDVCDEDFAVDLRSFEERAFAIKSELQGFQAQARRLFEDD